jgi:hypothetical protein
MNTDNYLQPPSKWRLKMRLELRLSIEMQVIHDNIYIYIVQGKIVRMSFP